MRLPKGKKYQFHVRWVITHPSTRKRSQKRSLAYYSYTLNEIDILAEQESSDGKDTCVSSMVEDKHQNDQVRKYLPS